MQGGIGDRRAGMHGTQVKIECITDNDKLVLTSLPRSLRIICKAIR